MERHEMKDKILHFVCNDIGQYKTTSTEKIAEILNLQWEDVYSCCLELSNENHIDTRQTSSSTHYHELSIMKHPNGISFLKYGGYTEKNKKDILPEQLAKSTISTNLVVKIFSILTFIIVLASCYIAYMQYSKVSEVSIKQLDSLKIELQKFPKWQQAQIDSSKNYRKEKYPLKIQKVSLKK